MKNNIVGVPRLCQEPFEFTSSGINGKPIVPPELANSIAPGHYVNSTAVQAFGLPTVWRGKTSAKPSTNIISKKKTNFILRKLG